MSTWLGRLTRLVHWRIHGFALGMTGALAAPILSQGCALSGQCPACGACAAKVSIAVVPLLIDGVLMVASGVSPKAAALLRQDAASQHDEPIDPQNQSDS
jgi:hypothetical protein